MLSGNHIIAGHGLSATPRRPRRFTNQYRRDVVAEVLNGTPLAQVARCHNLSINVVRRWKRKLSTPRATGHHEPYTTEFVRAVLADVRSGMTQATACVKHGVSRSGLHRWIAKAKRQPDAYSSNTSDGISIATLTKESELSLERQLQDLLTQYRTLHARIEHIRQLVAAA